MTRGRLSSTRKPCGRHPAPAARWRLVAACAAAAAHAAVAAADHAWAAQGVAVGGERLSAVWLRAAAQSGAAEASGQAPVLERVALRAGQSARRAELLALLDRLPREAQGTSAGLARLRDAIAAQPVTGRVPFTAHDARWLEVHPEADPVLEAGDAWRLPGRLVAIEVWRDDGRRCVLPYAAGAQADRYVAACPAEAPDRADDAWIVQPDGRVQRVGMAPWNAARQDPPAPGARIWAPRRGAGWDLVSSEALASWLATQAPVVADGTAAASMALPNGATAASPGERGTGPRDLPVTPGDWGTSGLIQTPSARSGRAGDLGIAVAATGPYVLWNAVLSPFDPLEVAVRYATLLDVPYEASRSGRSSVDKSTEIKWRVLEEGSAWPAIAVGLRDPLGTSLFAGEYVVASRRWGDWDFSAGLGWGYLGARGSWRNPLALFGRRWEQRIVRTTGQGGTASFRPWFTGRVAPFGGVQWHSPWRPLVLKLELDGNDYRHEPVPQPLRASSPVNLGAVWRFDQGFSVGLALERGDRVALNLAWHGSLPQVHTPKHSLPRPQPVERQAPLDGGTRVPDPDTALLRALSAQTGWDAVALDAAPGRWTVRFERPTGHYLNDRLERVWAALHQAAPDDVQQLRVILAHREVPLVQQEIDRWAWARHRTQWQPETPTSPAVDAPAGQRGAQPVPAEPGSADPGATSVRDVPRPWDLRVGLGLQQHLGGPDGYLYALSARVHGRLDLWTGAWAQGSVQWRVLDNYDRFLYTAPSLLPRVRTQVREYVTGRAVTLPNLQVTQVARFADGLYGQVYAGMLEPMFAGVGGEWLWRPLGRKVALGMDFQHVRQRTFEQDLRLRDYRVNTGHLSLYWDTGWKGVTTQVSAGQYLAGDRGATIELARSFGNGARIGAWVTKTNVSAAQFGEGSFDKGVFISLPFEALLTGWSAQTMSVVWQPLVRDGGARLGRAHTLWQMTQHRDLRALDLRAPPAGVPLD